MTKFSIDSDLQHRMMRQIDAYKNKMEHAIQLR